MIANHTFVHKRNILAWSYQHLFYHSRKESIEEGREGGVGEVGRKNEKTEGNLKPLM